MDFDWLAKVFRLEKLIESGHAQRREDQNLGLGHVYYGLVRAYRPKVIVVIGSWRGFVPIVMAKAQLDNAEGGRVVFIDPSMVDDFWKDSEEVFLYFNTFGLTNIEHYCMTTQVFTLTSVYKDLTKIGMLFVDGMHTAEQAKFDHESFLSKLGNNPALFHDSQSTMISTLYDEHYQHNVHTYINELRDRGYSVMDVPLGTGVAMVTLT